MEEKQELDDSAMIMSEIMTPEKVNFSGGNIHGGHLLSLLDKVAYACAARYSGKYVVTLSVDGVYFKKPIHVNELVTCLANINYVGKSSMEVGIKVIAQNLKTREVRHTNSCYFTMVAVDENFKPTKIPPLTLNTPIKKRRYREAKLRREMKLKLQKEHQQLKEKIRQETEE